MKPPTWIASIIVCACLATPLDAWAGKRAGGGQPFGLGVIAGEPTGGTLKLFLDDRFALQAHAAFLFFFDHKLVGSVDVLWYPSAITSNKWFDLLWYVGVGGAAGIDAPWYESRGGPREDKEWRANPAAWVRVPFGFSFFFVEVPVEAFVELGPSARLYPLDEFVDVLDPFVAVGGRWYF